MFKIIIAESNLRKTSFLRHLEKLCERLFLFLTKSSLFGASFEAFNKVWQISLAFLSRQKSENYQETFVNHLLPLEEIFGGIDWTFQHDKGSIHASKSTSQCLKSYMVLVLNRPALSPDFRPIENVWVVYQNGKRYSSVEELKSAIEDV
ncbi:hypothetical protein AVEN_90241-1 [Araneus ventricosus]|uniref:Tc1-like transposase DDE domain-containing protein n=1 Tax=Araneus ventricosus TaxID=182803 RepID=A0A4Y2Q2D2_ARAVE|nr:hypothetical protein AVEN_90241-1 [Araneus ventricosus]